MADATDQPTISDELGAAWIAARYDGGAMPEVAFPRHRRDPAGETRRAPPRTPTAFEAAFSRARSRELTADNPLHSIDLALHSKNARFMLTNA